ncbi:MAG TPA: TadE/TadG family type IV pilus assembly protein [Candidatus Limnocylindrales bacterium]|nr:TadE/TadG family type IV pilus assembly protein [Candidatus Limnocylindrales bacterium]
MSGHRNDSSRGQGLVEFVVILPLILLLMLALFDAGRAVIFYTELTNASRAGARVAVVNQSNDDTCAERTFKCAAADLTTAMAIAPSAIPDLTVRNREGTIVATDADECKIYGACSVTVAVQYDFQPVTPVISSLFGSINLAGSSTMQIERSHASP